MSLRYYLDEAQNRWRKARFFKQADAILHTPVVTCASAGPMVLSMVHHRDVLTYLLAIKSFARALPPSKVVVVADPTITPDDRKVLQQHVPGIEIRDAAEFRRPGVPVGGTWERLMAIACLSQDHYVIQLDADTVTLADVSEVRECFVQNVSFTIGTGDLQLPVPVGAAARWARGMMKGLAQPHVQLLCEAQVCAAAAAGDERKHYVRGCSGFAGFARQAISEADVVALSERMQAVLGEAWSRWGTEQFSSNYLIANAPGAVVLPHPMYTTPNRMGPYTVFVHFIGSQRFTSDAYLMALRNHLTSARAS
ncbi:hypothetical protein WNB94_05305 [Aquabacterium sp. A3]|uniref:hypothetical protein n=1 Tax=Aquabacterium sp. A3 TaxID=3132829 RepID=UPI00311A0F89